MTDSRATTRWTGDLLNGSGELTLDTSAAATFTVSLPGRIQELAGQTSPEELLAAAHASCLAMNFTATVAEKGLTATDTAVSATVSMGKVPDGFAITRIVLELGARVEGVDDDGFAAMAAHAEKTCPISKALAAAEIVLKTRRY